MGLINASDACGSKFVLSDSDRYFAASDTSDPAGNRELHG
jgi:hypothetical protein